jgi:hypothetical protein
MKRLIQLDILRGLFLVLIVINHTPNPLRAFTDQPFGFFSAAEGFVFVSAFLAGMVFLKRLQRDGLTAASAASVRRAKKLYFAHATTVGIAFLLGGILFSSLPGFHNMLAPVKEMPVRATAASLVLLYQPPLLDILPLYIVFSLATPLVFYLAKRSSWTVCLLISALLWVLSWFGLRGLVLSWLAAFPVLDPGAFDPFAWQFLWVVGLYCGQSAASGKALLPPTKTNLWLLGSLTIGLLLLRHVTLPPGSDLGQPTWLISKWTLGPLRLLNFLIAGWSFFHLMSRIRSILELMKPLLLIGENTLPIFCFQLCVSILVIGLIDSFDVPEVVTVAAAISQVGLMFVFGHWLQRTSRASA